MTSARFGSVLMVLAAFGFFSTHLTAGDKKKEDKKVELAKDIIIEGELINADLKDRVHTQSFCKTYTFKVEKDKSYQFTLAAQNFQPILRLENLDGAQLDQGFAQFGAANVFLRPAKTGDVQIVATTPNGGSMGKFTLTIKELPQSDGKPIELKNENGRASKSAVLMANDPVYKGGKRHKMFLFEMTAGKTYQIDMTSKAFDSYLFLESPDGKLLAQDDDGGGYPSARIIHKAAAAGKHRIICTYFGGGAGEFNLSIQQKD